MMKKVVLFMGVLCLFSQNSAFADVVFSASNTTNQDVMLKVWNSAFEYSSWAKIPAGQTVNGFYTATAADWITHDNWDCYVDTNTSSYSMSNSIETSVPVSCGNITLVIGYQNGVGPEVTNGNCTSGKSFAAKKGHAPAKQAKKITK